MKKEDIDYVESVLSGKVASCVPDGRLEPPAGAKCTTRKGFKKWLKKANGGK